MGADMLSPVALALLPTQALARKQVPTFLIKLGHILPGWDAKEPYQGGRGIFFNYGRNEDLNLPSFPLDMLKIIKNK